ncbi:MAG: SpoIID/LytB domain-containing protein [Lachnospiraceae bacterium]|nr:SpoIID/LytB domain-containing protein [Lachnospiraceae bacterium]
MKEKLRIIIKLALIIFCTCFFIWLIWKDEKVFKLKQPVGEGISISDMMILMEAVAEKEEANPANEDRANQIKSWITEMEKKYAGKAGEYIFYEDYIELISILPLEKAEMEKLVLKEKYKEGFYLLKKDWYDSFDKILYILGLDDIITTKEMNLLAEITEETMIDDNGNTYLCKAKSFGDCSFSTVTAYLDGSTLLTVKERQRKGFTLSNLWIMEADEAQVMFFYKNHEINYVLQQGDEENKVTRESVADLTFKEGRLTAVKSKEERINGKLLRLSEEELEIEGEGTFDIDENCRIYQLYEELREAGRQELRIGYDFTDFVVDDGKICAALIMRKENMESIRVAVKTNGFASLYHDSISLSVNCDAYLTYGPYGERITKELRKGEKIVLDSESEYLKGDRAELTPSVKSGEIQILSLTRNQGIPSCRGKMEIAKTADGLVLINDLLLEEYLYSVVPSEMPASYSMEALKAQAVCARTYAYRYLMTPGLSGIGAHVDDSVSYQVYNNITENVNSTKAVKETTGNLLYYGDEAVSTYYYSTSCGFGTDAGVWKAESSEEMPYLTSLHIADGENGEEDDAGGESMISEEVFREYIMNIHEGDYEKDEAWYRWTYEVKNLDVKEMSDRLQQRFQADNSKVLTFAGTDTEKDTDEYLTEPPAAFDKIYNISVLKRRAGGVADELLVETNKGTYKILSEYNIRYILNNGGAVKRQDDTEMESTGLLPSAYLILDIVKDEESVIGYTILGGGYGHGVGMSQNGAGAMGNAGKSCEEILMFFYPGCQIKKIY